MRSRTTPTELAEAMARNPQLRLKRPSTALGRRTAPMVRDNAISPREPQARASGARQNKYRNKPTNGFASKKESRRYDELVLLARAGAIAKLRTQPKYVLLEAFERDGEKHRAAHYIGDFSYIENGKEVCEDTKGMLTPLFRLKRKLFLSKYPEIELRVF